MAQRYANDQRAKAQGACDPEHHPTARHCEHSEAIPPFLPTQDYNSITNGAIAPVATAAHSSHPLPSIHYRVFPILTECALSVRNTRFTQRQFIRGYRSTPDETLGLTKT